ncbi:DUF3850 domain-containing protein [Spirosoma foliorum]|uniref:DUF3850 domain-containing protein n=2 Tax=Spirosoma foliorum TaxID=2710596 RepID=A0A7G5H785_9BACT|nr:DUF3850 domain-containing protein [Spirosoma foliorum]
MPEPTPKPRHKLKCLPEFFQEVKAGYKGFECRLNDRNYQVGDELLLEEWSEESGYSGDSVLVDVAYVLPGGQFGIEPGYCVMSIVWSINLDFNKFLYEEGPEHEDGFPITTFCG